MKLEGNLARKEEENSKESLESFSERPEQLEDPQALLEDALEKLRNIKKGDLNAEETEISLQNALDMLQEEDIDKLNEEDGESVFCSIYQGINNSGMEKYLDKSSMDKIKHSLASKFGIDIQEGEEIMQLVDLDQQLEETERELKEDASHENLSEAELIKNKEQVEKYFAIKQKIKKGQQEIVGQQESFRTKAGKMLKEKFSEAGEKIDFKMLNNKLLKFLGEKQIASKTLKTAAAGSIALMAAGSLFSPDSAEAAEMGDDVESEKEDFIKLMEMKGLDREQAKEAYENRLASLGNFGTKDNFYSQEKKSEQKIDTTEEPNPEEKEIINGPIKFEASAGTVYERNLEEGELDLVKQTRTIGAEDGWYEYDGRWVDVGDSMGSRFARMGEIEKHLNKLEIDYSQDDQEKIVRHYHPHPLSFGLIKDLSEAGGLRPVPPSLGDIDFYVSQTEDFTEKGKKFEGGVTDLTGIWRIKNIDTEKMPDNFEDRYQFICSKLYLPNFDLKDIEKFIKEADDLGIELEYNIVHEDELKNDKEGLKKVVQEYLKANNKDAATFFPPDTYEKYIKDILEDKKTESERAEKFKSEESGYAKEEEATYQNNLNLIVEHNDLSNLEDDNWQKFLENKTLSELIEILDGSTQVKGIDLATAKKLNDFLKPHLESNNPFPASTLLKDVISEIDI